MKELIDVVDNKDRVIGKADREECHKKGLKHRVSAVWVFNDKGELLLSKRAENVWHPNTFDHSAAGHLKSGETYLEAAKKELREELGIKCYKFKKIKKFQKKSFSEGKVYNHFITLFFCNSNEYKVNKKEIASAKFYPLSKMKEKLNKNKNKFRKSFAKIFKLLEREGKLKIYTRGH